MNCTSEIWRVHLGHSAYFGKIKTVMIIIEQPFMPFLYISSTALSPVLTLDG